MNMGKAVPCDTPMKKLASKASGELRVSRISTSLLGAHLATVGRVDVHLQHLHHAFVGGGEGRVLLDRGAVLGDHLLGRPCRLHHRVGQPDRPLTGGLDRREIVGDVDQGGARA